MKAYSANQISFILGGIPIDQGKGPDTFLEIEANNERFSVKSGIDGEATLYENLDDTHKVTVYLMQSSSANDILSGIFTAARGSGGGVAGVVPLIVKDKQGTSVLASLEAVIAGWPKRAYGKEPDAIQWTIYVINPTRFEGGNSSV